MLLPYEPVMMKDMICTSSWDDGHVLDKHLAGVLHDFELAGTFYISRNLLKKERLSEMDIKSISKRHEVGAHTISHSNLTEISESQQQEEIVNGKRWLEEVTGTEVSMFCYPKGQYSEAAKKLVKKAGYKGARTTKQFSLYPSHYSPFELPTTLQVYPFPFRRDSKNRYAWRRLLQPIRRGYAPLRRMGVPVSSMTSWTKLACTIFDRVRERGGVFHLWGHSWEIERYNMWNELEALFAYMHKQGGYKACTNGQVIDELFYEDTDSA